MNNKKPAWYLSNINRLKTDNYQESLFTNIKGIFYENDKNISLHIDGYIIPRLSVYDQYKDLPQTDLIFALYKRYGLKFIEYVKGLFTIILLHGDKFYIFNDRHGIQRYFIYQRDGQFIISNSLKFISDSVPLSVSRQNIATYCLLDHFMDGMTIFEEVTCSKPASFLRFEDELKIDSYWGPQGLFSQSILNQSFEVIADTWKALIANYIEYLKPRQISLTLTGGNDSRMVLAALLANDIKPNTFTFGNPESADGIIGQQVAGSLQLRHSNHFVATPSKEWFSQYAMKLVAISNSLVNIHRAHRMDAIEREKEKHPDTDMLFTGLVGGEYIKEPAYDDITIPHLFKWWNDHGDIRSRTEKIKSNLNSMGFKTFQVEISSFLDTLAAVLDCGEGFNQKQKKFIYTYDYYATSHHIQDPIVFENYVVYVVNPFMDVDFLELLASYPGWYVHRKTTVFDKLWHSFFILKIIDQLAPELSEIPFAKKGKYTGSELLHRPVFYLMKRGTHFIRNDRKKYPRNFPMGKWLYDFSKDQLREIHPEVKALFDYDFLERTLESIKDDPSEETWHAITNPINLSMILDHYAKD